jgi:[histone H3]-lysine9 N-trimethyltransferase SUV39H
VTVVNEEDDATLPRQFRFLETSVLGAGVRAAEASFRSGCECADDEDCQYEGCLCLQDQDDSDAEPEDAGGRTKLYRYHMHGAKAGLLRSRFLASQAPIYECHDGCSCTESCPNRVVERGRKVPLQIFRTEHTGWGECPPSRPEKRASRETDQPPQASGPSPTSRPASSWTST